MAALPKANSVTAEFAPRLIEWQRSQGRHSLPWQNTRDPYRVWLSEIMLQQTQVATVLGYYERFLQRFPDVLALAAAPLDDVLTLWQGLGYYSRARNLHRCAQTVAEQHGGRFPRTSEALAELPGIGRSTAAAIAAFCFGERVAILDGNVKRVLTRVLAFGGDLAQGANERLLWAEATALLPAQGIEPYTQGLMDLGATLCTARSPSCLLCPVDALCEARRLGSPEAFPIKSRKLKRSVRENWWLWLEWQGRVWLQQRPETGVWAGLWTLPMFESEADLLAMAARLDLAGTRALPSIRHVLTHFDWNLHPVKAQLVSEPSAEIGKGRWVSREALGEIALPSPLKKLLASGA